MLPRRLATPQPPAELPRSPDAIVEILESQIAADRASSRPGSGRDSRAGSRSDSRRILQKKKPQSAAEGPLRRARPKPAPAARSSCGISAGPQPAPPPPALCYFDRLAQASVFDDPLCDFPELRRLLAAADR
jgi:hypothetical protein